LKNSFLYIKIVNNIYLNILNLHKIIFLKRYMLQEKISLQDYLLSKTDSILLHKIILKYPVKNIVNLISTLKFIAELDGSISKRELYTKMQESWISISLITLWEYLSYFLEEKIITTIPRYEIKTWKTIINKVEYYFSDTAIRDALSHFTLKNSIRAKNNIYCKLYISWYNLFTWKNRSFYFDFIALSPNKPTLFITVFNWDSKYELKKIVNKMIKIHALPWENSLLSNDYKKYVVVDSFQKLWIQKRRYWDLEIIEAEKFLELTTK